MTEAEVGLVEQWADRFEEWPEFAEAAFQTAMAQPGNLGLRARLERIAQRRWRKGAALLRLWEVTEPGEAKLEVVAEPRGASKSFRRSIGKSDFFIWREPQPKAELKAEPATGAEPGAPDAAISQGSEGEAEAKGEVLESIGRELVAASSHELVHGFQPPTADHLSKLLKAMNQRHAVIGNVGGKCKVVEWIPSELDPAAQLPVFQSKADVINRYANVQVGWTRKGEPLTLGTWWFGHSNRTNYRGVVFRPGAPEIIVRPESGSWMNLWKGWGIVPVKGDWRLLRKHVEEILCNGDQKAMDYALWWTGWGFQNPGERAESSLVIRGKKGVGKGLFLGTTRAIYGPHGLQITHSHQLTGNFNAHLATCCLLWADEAFWAGDKQGEAVLKGLITELSTMVEKKGIDAYQSRNCTKLGISSNSDWIVPATSDERRYGVTDANPKYAKGVMDDGDRKEYFGPIWKEVAQGGAAAMLWDMLNLDLKGWHPREVPVTTGLMRQKKESLRGNYQWFEALLQNGELPANFEGRANWVLSAVLLSFVKTFRGQEYATEESISSFLYGEMGFSAELVSKGGNKFRSRDESGKAKRGYVFPPLGELRSKWETRYGGDWNWHEPLREWQSCCETSMLDVPTKLITKREA